MSLAIARITQALSGPTTKLVAGVTAGMVVGTAAHVGYDYASGQSFSRDDPSNTWQHWMQAAVIGGVPTILGAAQIGRGAPAGFTIAGAGVGLIGATLIGASSVRRAIAEQ